MLKLNLGKESKLLSAEKTNCFIIMHSMHHIKKGFDCKKNRICFETAHAKKVV